MTWDKVDEKSDPYTANVTWDTRKICPNQIRPASQNALIDYKTSKIREITAKFPATMFLCGFWTALTAKFSLGRKTVIFLGFLAEKVWIFYSSTGCVTRDKDLHIYWQIANG